MDQLDVLLEQAWDRVSARLRKNPRLALVRSRRLFKGVMTRPMREWCLVIRASDTRINPMTAGVENPPDCDWVYKNPVGDMLPHVVTLTGELIRRLTEPVYIPYPGVSYREAARLCGRPWNTMKVWARWSGFQIDYRPQYGYRKPVYINEFAFPGEQPADRIRISGGRPYLWTPSPIDPNNFNGRAPHRMWGTMWQWHHRHMTDDFEMRVMRQPVWRDRLDRHLFRGWQFVCPGRMRDGVHVPCGRHCRYLYLPLPVWTLGRAMRTGDDEADEALGFELPEDSGLSGRWYPGRVDRTAPPRGRSFACKECWYLRSASMSGRNGWNEFISHISGGLLYGRDVPRPLDLFPIERKKHPYRRRSKSERLLQVSTAKSA